MTHSEVKELHPGDEVYWSDPDEGAASRNYRIRTIEMFDTIVVIQGFDGSSLECFPQELL